MNITITYDPGIFDHLGGACCESCAAGGPCGGETAAKSTLCPFGGTPRIVKGKMVCVKGTINAPKKQAQIAKMNLAAATAAKACAALGSPKKQAKCLQKAFKQAGL